MIKGVRSSHFPMLRSAIKSAQLNWYAIHPNGHASRATDQIIDAAFEHFYWCEDPKVAFVLGDPQDLAFEEIVYQRTERTAFYRYLYDWYAFDYSMLIRNFDKIPLDGVEVENVDWYFGEEPFNRHEKITF